MAAIREYMDRSRDWRSAIMLTVPLFVLYEIGLAFFTEGTVRNAADFLLRDLFGFHGTRGALLANSLVLVLFLVAALTRKRSKSSFACLPYLLAESALYAVLLLPLTSLIVPLMAPSEEDPFSHLVLSIGAGLYEELLFRLGLVAGGFTVLRRVFRMHDVWAGCVAILVSSLLFSAYHHVGAGGEPFVSNVFAFRFLAGVLLGWLFLLRGFAVVCWTHALYDVFCIL